VGIVRDFFRAVFTVVGTIVVWTVIIAFGLVMFVGFSGCVRYKGELPAVALIEHFTGHTTSTPTPPSPPALQTYTSSKYRFSFEYDPSRSTVSEDPRGVPGTDFTVVLISKEHPTKEVVSFSVFVRRLPPYFDSHDKSFMHLVGVGLIDDARKVRPKARFGDLTVLELGGLPGVVYQMEDSVAGVAMHWAMIRLYGQTEAFQITQAAPISEWPGVQDYFIEVVRSFRTPKGT
jgi:hypothetical protein